MIFGFPPFFDENEKSNTREKSDQIIYRKIKQGFTAKVMPSYGPWFPSDHSVSASCRDLISRLLRTSLADRITAEEALEHPWLKGASCNNDKLTRVEIGNPTILKSIKGFKQKCGLQAEILKLLRECNYLNASQVDSVKSFFEAADVNKDGKISFDELYQALKEIDPEITTKDAHSIIDSMDANHDGYMDYEELLSSRINRKLQSKEARLRKVFKALDLDDSGKISADELKAALESVSDAVKVPRSKCLELIQEVDVNHDGEIDFEEFISVFSAVDEEPKI
jgi:calcium-dependent protein kinase